MTVTEELRDVFDVFHDGGIEGGEYSQGSAKLKIGCLYLAEVINPKYEFFYLALNKLRLIEYETWSEEDLTIKDKEIIFNLGIEILSADIDELNRVVVTTHCHDSERNFDGGNLILDCENFEVFDHQENKITLEQLQSIAKQYWSSL